MVNPLVGCLVGVLLGVRHAVEPDHLAAVTTLTVSTRTPWRGALLGAFWGLGHTLALLALGGTLVAMQRQLSPRWVQGLEGLVGLVLIVLGIGALRRAWRDGRRGPLTVHGHSGKVHDHPTLGPHVHLGPWTLLRRPLLVGFAHGLAGSGTLTAAVLVSLPTLSLRLTYILLFGVGSALGMALLSGVLGVPLARAMRLPRLHRTLATCAGATSVLFGVYWTASAIGHLLRG